MVIPLQKCCCLPVRPGCVLIGIMFGIENLGGFITITLMIRGTDFDHPKDAESKALHITLLFLAVMSLAMFFSDIFLIVGTVMKWKSVLYAWVVVYTALICTKTLTFIITAIMCILATNCRLTIGVLMLAVAYIPMALYCYCVIVVYSYFIIVTQGSGFRSIMPADGSEGVSSVVT